MKYIEIKAFSTRIFRDVERKHLQLIAAGFAFYFLTSLLPALVLAIGIMAFLPLENAMQVTTSFVGNVLPPQGVAMIEGLLSTITLHRTGLLSFGIISTLWLASKGVKGIIGGLDIVYDVRTPRALWINKILAFGLTFAVGVLLLVGVVLTVAGPAVESLLSRAASVQSLWARIWPYIQWSLSATFTFAAIVLLFVVAPNVPRGHRVIIPGALVATATWLALAWGLGFYLQFAGAKMDRVYGTLATPIALMLWLYWSSFAILIGAEINVNLEAHRRIKESDLENELLRRMDAA